MGIPRLVTAMALLLLTTTGCGRSTLPDAPNGVDAGGEAAHRADGATGGGETAGTDRTEEVTGFNFQLKGTFATGTQAGGCSGTVTLGKGRFTLRRHCLYRSPTPLAYATGTINLIRTRRRITILFHFENTLNDPTNTAIAEILDADRLSFLGSPICQAYADDPAYFFTCIGRIRRVVD